MEDSYSKNVLRNPFLSELWKSIFLNSTPISEHEAFISRKKVSELLPDPPIIIGGCGRSGTTVLHSILSSHPDVYAIPSETCFFCPSAYGELEKPSPLEEIDTNANFNLDPFFVRCFDGFLQPNRKRWCEKTPRNVLFFGKILEFFGEDIRLIHAVRDGRDVVLSHHPSDPEKFWVEPERWITEVRAGVKFLNHPQVFTLRYEDLVFSFEKKITELCAFTGLPICSEILNWHDHATYRFDPAWTKEVDSLHSQSIGRWKGTEKKERVSKINENPEALNLLKVLGYEV